MWTCPECGRIFKKQNQSHYCGKAPETVEAYIPAQPEEAQQHLRAIRNAVTDWKGKQFRKYGGNFYGERESISDGIFQGLPSACQ